MIPADREAAARRRWPWHPWWSWWSWCSWWLLAVFVLPLSIHARQRAQGDCDLGQQSVLTNGLAASGKFIASYPCTVNVYLTGTTTPVTIYSDNSGTVLSAAGTFTCPSLTCANGHWFFYADNGRYDVALSGGGMVPWTIGDILLDDPSGGGTTVTSITGGAGISASPATGAVTVSSAWGAPPAGTQTRYLQVQPNTGNVTTYRWNGLPQTVSTDYAYTQTPGGSLTGGGGSQTVPMSPCPKGIYGNGIWMPVEISGGTGTAESTVPTGGTCSSNPDGITSGTIIISPTNSHSGSWTVTSATGGVCDAIAAGALSVYIPISSPATFHNVCTIPNNVSAVFVSDSIGISDPSVIRAADYATGNLFYGSGSGITLSFSNFSFSNGSSTGIAIQLVGGSLHASNFNCTGGVFLSLNGTGGIQISDFFYYDNQPGFALPHAILIGAGGGNNAATDSRFVNGRVEGNWSGAGIEITGADSLDISAVTINGMQTGVLIDPPTGGSYVTNMRIHSGEIDAGSASNPMTAGIKIVQQSTVIIGSIAVEGVDFLGYSQPSEAFAIDAGTTGAGYIGDLKIEGCHIFNWNVGIGVGQIGFGGGRSTIINGNTVVASVSHGITLNTPLNVLITGNIVIGNGGYGISISGATSHLLITGNNLGEGTYANTSGPVNGGASSGTTTVIMVNNVGIDNVAGTVATSATVALPFNPYFTLTGNSGTITAFSNMVGVGQTWHMTVTGTGNATSAAATVGNACTLAQNKMYTLVFDGTKVWVNGPGC